MAACRRCGANPEATITSILVVEDESVIREVLVEVLRDAGFEIVEAVTADAAVALLEQDDLVLIVTDINLPGQLDGIDLAFSARLVRPSIPLIFISGRPGKLAEARTFGCPVAFLQKPFSLQTLVNNVQRLTGTVE